MNSVFQHRIDCRTSQPRSTSRRPISRRPWARAMRRPSHADFDSGVVAGQGPTQYTGFSKQLDYQEGSLGDVHRQFQEWEAKQKFVQGMWIIPTRAPVCLSDRLRLQVREYALDCRGCSLWIDIWESLASVVINCPLDTERSLVR